MQAEQGARAPAAPGAPRHRSGQVAATQNRGNKPHNELTPLPAAKRWKKRAGRGLKAAGAALAPLPPRRTCPPPPAQPSARSHAVPPRFWRRDQQLLA